MDRSAQPPIEHDQAFDHHRVTIGSLSRFHGSVCNQVWIREVLSGLLLNGGSKLSRLGALDDASLCKMRLESSTAYTVAGFEFLKRRIAGLPKAFDLGPGGLINADVFTFRI